MPYGVGLKDERPTSNIQHSMLDVRCSMFVLSVFDLPAMPLNWREANLIIVIHNSMITLTQRTMHGRRGFIFSVLPGQNNLALMGLFPGRTGRSLKNSPIPQIIIFIQYFPDIPPGGPRDRYVYFFPADSR